jgi:hypothetical protein
MCNDSIFYWSCTHADVCGTWMGKGGIKLGEMSSCRESVFFAFYSCLVSTVAFSSLQNGNYVGGECLLL